MPTWSTLSPFWIPCWFSWFCCFPQCEILFIFLLVVLINLFSLGFSIFYSFQFSISKLLFIFLQIKINGSIWYISISVFYNFLNKTDNFWYIFCHSGQVIWFINTQTIHILKEVGLPFFSKLKILNFLVFRIFNDFVINISDVHSKLS